MSKKLSLSGLSDYIGEKIGAVGAVRQEGVEVQTRFNSVYVEWKARHDATLEQLVDAIVAAPEKMGLEFRRQVDDRLPEEQGMIEERRRQLRMELIPQARADADEALAVGKALTDKLRQMNPKLDKREERLKNQRIQLEAELDELNTQIRRLSGCLVVVFTFFRVNKLDRRRHEVLGQLKEMQEQLREVREEWAAAQKETQAEQDVLQKRWQEQTLALAQYQGEKGFLDEELNREALAFKRAVRYVVDNLTERTPYPVAEVKATLDAMVDLNIQTDDYEAALRSVVEFLALLDGIGEGLSRFNESVQGLIEEQRMHSAYLPKLKIELPDSVLVYHTQWQGLADLVRDDAHLGAQPAEFVAAVQPVLDSHLSEKAISAMFESMGRALQSATARWKG